jgi:hypothetical protein
LIYLTISANYHAATATLSLAVPRAQLGSAGIAEICEGGGVAGGWLGGSEKIDGKMRKNGGKMMKNGPKLMEIGGKMMEHGEMMKSDGKMRKKNVK